MASIGRFPEFTGEARAADGATIGFLSHHKRHATRPVRSGSRPSGPVSRFLGASTTLTDAMASLSGPLLPRNRDTGSYECHMLDSVH